MKNQRGYEYYAKMNEKLAVYGDQKAIEFFADLQVYGTPEQVYDKVRAIHQQTNNAGFVGVFSYAGMPHEEAARNMRLFARAVMPELKAFDAGAPIGQVAAAARPAFRSGAAPGQRRGIAPPGRDALTRPPSSSWHDRCSKRSRRRMTRGTAP